MLPERPASAPGADQTAAAGAADTEASLMARITTGERRAFEALYRLYFPRLVRFLERVIRRPHAVEEVLNDTMLVVWNKAATFNGQSKVSTWIFGIAYRKALKALRRIDDPVEVDGEDGEGERGFGDAPPGPEDELMLRQQATILGAALARMTPQQRAVIELTYYHGCPYREIAEIMSCPVDTVKTRMFHARRRLRELLADREGDLA